MPHVDVTALRKSDVIDYLTHVLETDPTLAASLELQLPAPEQRAFIRHVAPPQNSNSSSVNVTSGGDSDASQEDTLAARRRRRRRQASSSTDVCFLRGSATLIPGYVRLCTTCSSTTNLGSDYWPSFLNEASCDQADLHCLYADGLGRK